MAICGLNISLDAIQGDITAKISGIIDLNSTLTSVSALTDYKATLDAGMSSIKSKVSSMIPDIPVSLSGFTSLRDQLSAYASAPGASALASITSQFGGLTSLTGMANINLSDLASSALSIGASFDPCSAASGIPNIMSNAAGELEALADQAPDLGGTVMALKRQIDDSKVYDSLSLGTLSNVAVLKSTSVSAVTAAKTAISDTGNVVTIYGGGAFIKTLPGGGEMVQTSTGEQKQMQREAISLEDESKICEQYYVVELVPQGYSDVFPSGHSGRKQKKWYDCNGPVLDSDGNHKTTTYAQSVPLIGIDPTKEDNFVELIDEQLPPGYEMTPAGYAQKTAQKRAQDELAEELAQEALDDKKIQYSKELAAKGTINGYNTQGTLTQEHLDSVEDEVELNALINDVANLD